MPLQLLTSPPTAPQRSNDSDTFNDRADAFVSWFSTHVTEMNTLTAQLMATSALIAVAPDYADPGLSSIASLSIGADQILYGTGTDTFATQTLTPFARTLIDDVDASAMRTTLGLGTAATQTTSAFLQPSNDLSDLNDAATARTNLGLGTAATASSAFLVPSGAVMAFAMNSAPTGWLECDGSAVSRTTYAALFAAIGTTFGTGDGSTTFNLPDLRAEFVRGWDNGRGVDSGRSFGSWQDHEFEAHTHGINYGSSGASTYSADPDDGNSVAQSGSAGGDETRPRNVALLYAVKT